MRGEGTWKGFLFEEELMRRWFNGMGGAREGEWLPPLPGGGMGGAREGEWLPPLPGGVLQSIHSELIAPPQDPDSSEDKAHGTISMGTYFRFFRAGSNYVFLFIILVLFVLAEVSIMCSS